MVRNAEEVNGAPGWRAALYLELRRKGGRTLVATRRHSGPLLIQRPFYPEGDTCHVYLLHPPGGIVGGDQLLAEVRLEDGAQALITTPGATKFYRSAGETSGLRQHFHLAADSCLEWLPQDNIFFPGAQAKLETSFHLAPGARLFAWEMLCLGRPVMGEIFSHGALHTRLQVTRQGAPLLHERLRIIDGSLDKLAGHALVSTVLISPASQATLNKAREILDAFTAPAGATLLDDLLVVRALAHRNLEIQNLLHQLWRGLRYELTGKPPLPPGIWST